MLLRASGERDNTEVNLAAVTSQDEDAGVPDSQWLRVLTEHAIARDFDAMPAALRAAAEVMGAQAACDVLVVAAAFNGITRVADATGIPLDDNTRETTESMRAEVGLNAFDYREKSARYQ